MKMPAVTINEQVLIDVKFFIVLPRKCPRISEGGVQVQQKIPMMHIFLGRRTSMRNGTTMCHKSRRPEDGSFCVNRIPAPTIELEML